MVWSNDIVKIKNTKKGRRQTSFNEGFADKVIHLTWPQFIAILGDAGSGKGACLGLFTEYFFLHDCLVLDLLASDVDHENLCYLVEGKDGVRYKVLLVHSEYTDVTVDDEMSPWVRCETDKLGLLELCRIAAAEDRILVFDVATYDPAHYRQILSNWLSGGDGGLMVVMKHIWKEYKLRGCALFRELHKICPSVGVSHVGDAGQMLKENFEHTVKERRHSKLFMMYDTQRDIDVAKDVRSLVTLRVVRRSPERLLERDVTVINDVVGSYRERASHRVAVKEVYRKIDELKHTDLIAYHTQGDLAGKMMYRRGIPLPNYGYIDSFNEDIEDILGVRFKYNEAARKEMLHTEKSDPDMIWLNKVFEIIEDGNSHKAIDMYRRCSYPGTMREFITKVLGVAVSSGYASSKTLKGAKVYSLADEGMEVLPTEHLTPTQSRKYQTIGGKKAPEEHEVDSLYVRILLEGDNLSLTQMVAKFGKHKSTIQHHRRNMKKFGVITDKRNLTKYGQQLRTFYKTLIADKDTV